MLLVGQIGSVGVKVLPDHILFFDAECLLCHRSVRWLSKGNRNGALYFAPLGGETAQEILPRDLAIVKGADGNSVILASKDREGNWSILQQSDAILAVLKASGGAPMVKTLLSAFPRPLRNFGYDQVARSRHAVFGRAEECGLPSEELRVHLLQ